MKKKVKKKISKTNKTKRAKKTGGIIVTFKLDDYLAKRLLFVLEENRDIEVDHLLSKLLEDWLDLIRPE